MRIDPTGMIGVGPDGGPVSSYWMHKFVNWLFGSISHAAPSQSSSGPLAKPIDHPIASYKSGGRQFGAHRNSVRKHAAADLLVKKGEKAAVHSMQDGTIVSGHYYFYSGTYAVEVKNDNGTILRYGEIAKTTPSDAKKGMRVKAGQVIGNLTPNTRDGNCMLHLELYSGSGSGPLTNRSNPGFQRRSDLENPTTLLDTVYSKK